MNVTIVGGGNIGTQFAVHYAEKGNKVTMFTSKPKKFNRELIVIDENEDIIHKGIIEKATSDCKEAFENADLIFVITPAYTMEAEANKILPYVKEGMKICLVPGTGGGECAFKKCIDKGAILFGVQRVPSVARLVEYGHITRAVGYRNEMFVSSIPNKYVDECKQIIEDGIGIKTSVLPNYLNITLTPSNPILHTSRLRTIFKNFKEGIEYDHLPLFYEDWNNETSELLFKMDDEVQRICKTIDKLDLSYVKSLKIHYESNTPESMTKKISSIDGFKGLTTPGLKLDDGKYIPDLSSRYFTADFPYGLKILVEIADLIDIDVPYLKETMDWYYSIVGNNIDEFDFSKYGINSKDDLIKFYKK